MMHFSHHPAVWSDHPELVAGVLCAHGIRADVDAGSAVERYEAAARERLAAVESESELPEIQAWRRAFQRMGLKPTQYRCASESLLRRLRKEGAMPRIHPLIDVCNAISMAFAIPVAVIDLAQVQGSLQVRPADGSERYLTFGGAIEHPEPGEISFVDDAGNAHARRWTNRQSGLSAVREATSQVLVVCEALHPSAAADMPRLLAAIAGVLQEVWSVSAPAAILSAHAPVFEAAAG
ncbi:MAG TPA: phenylalanine--tRNA ligase beta subunit-related protein [Ramlibacter sp.]